MDLDRVTGVWMTTFTGTLPLAKNIEVHQLLNGIVKLFFREHPWCLDPITQVLLEAVTRTCSWQTSSLEKTSS